MISIKLFSPLFFFLIQDDLRVVPPKKRKKGAVIELDDSDWCNMLMFSMYVHGMVGAAEMRVFIPFLTYNWLASDKTVQMMYMCLYVSEITVQSHVYIMIHVEKWQVYNFTLALAGTNRWYSRCLWHDMIVHARSQGLNRTVLLCVVLVYKCIYFRYFVSCKE